MHWFFLNEKVSDIAFIYKIKLRSYFVDFITFDRLYKIPYNWCRNQRAFSTRQNNYTYYRINFTKNLRLWSLKVLVIKNFRPSGLFFYKRFFI